MPTPRNGETREEMNARRRAEARRWTTVRRTLQDGAVRSEVEVPEREPFEPLQNGAYSRRSTLVDAEGNVIQTWHVEKPEEKERWAHIQAMVGELKQDLPRAPYIPPPVEMTDDDFMAAYPVGDHHMGMLAWKHEVGASYDLDIAETILDKAGQHLIGTMFPATHAVVVFLGDYMHYDSMNQVTPGHGNLLDGDGRAAKMVRTAARAMRRLIEQAAEKHRFVHVIIEFGNHDPYSTLWLQEAMRTKYEDNPRISIDCAPGSYHYHRFGKVLLGTHHGDKAKWADLPLIMASDRSKDWGETVHRHIWTGHIHTLKAQDFQGCSVESFRVLAPPDAWAHGEGYRSKRDMKAVLFHKEMGEVARYSFNPEMMR